MVDRFIDTGGIVDHHRLNKLSLHNVLLLEITFGHGYCLFVLYPHPIDLSMSVGNNILDVSRDLIISIGPQAHGAWISLPPLPFSLLTPFFFKIFI
jgi:hypothetical protein